MSGPPITYVKYVCTKCGAEYYKNHGAQTAWYFPVVAELSNTGRKVIFKIVRQKCYDCREASK